MILSRSARMANRMCKTAGHLRRHPDDAAAIRRYDRQLAAFDRLAAAEKTERAAERDSYDGMITLTWVLAAVVIAFVVASGVIAELVR